MTGITINSLTKRFGSTTAVDALDLAINSGELFFLLGPSGCGKTTLLRMIAGFIDPTAGSIRFGERDVTHLPPNQRNTGMVFQSYALWPHMTVAQNVAYGLDVRKVPAGEKQRRVMEALKSVHMEHYAERKPNQLSGGQQQRVALARALVIQPTVLLLDEPLSNLDAKLRLEMRSEIRRICKSSGITGVYVTHDQKEALSMADRMAVLRAGAITQVGTPQELYLQPRTRFVADFLGETNFVAAKVMSVDQQGVTLETAAGALLAKAPPGQLARGQAVTCSIRPEAWRLHWPGDASPFGTPAGAPDGCLGGTVRSTMYLGESAQHTIRLADDLTVHALEMNPRSVSRMGEGSRVWLSVEAPDVVLLLDEQPG